MGSENFRGQKVGEVVDNRSSVSGKSYGQPVIVIEISKPEGRYVYTRPATSSEVQQAQQNGNLKIHHN